MREDPSSLYELRRGKQRAEDRGQRTEDRLLKAEVGMRNAECKKLRRSEAQKIRSWEDTKKP